jgi:hypothetical protein
MAPSPGKEAESITGGGALDLSALESKLFNLSPRRQPSSSASSSPSEGSFSISRRHSKTFYPEKIQSFHPSVNQQALQETFSHLCLDCVRRFTSTRFFETFASASKPVIFQFNQEIADLQDSSESCRFCSEVYRQFLFFWGYRDEGDWECVSVSLEPELSKEDEELIGLTIHVTPLEELPQEFVYTDWENGQFWIHTLKGQISNSILRSRRILRADQLNR